MKVTIQTKGFADLDRLLGQLPESVGKGVLRRTGLKALEPTAEAARRKERERTGTLKERTAVGTKLSRRQAREAKAETKSYVEVYAGPGSLPQAITEEFGTFDQEAHPFLRPAWAETAPAALDTVGRELGAAIEKSAKRLARKRVKAGS